MATKKEKQIKVTLVKSTIGCLKNQKANVEALGLHKIGSSRIHADNAVTRGMISKVSHLVKVEEV
ncbi:50S ribosomal protein L30 [Acidaminococcus sp. CAG:917]|nr:50S ribosomal protein L30 [Acidaminococcus sp. CAG:917]